MALLVLAVKFGSSLETIEIFRSGSLTESIPDLLNTCLRLRNRRKLHTFDIDYSLGGSCH